MRRSIAIDLLIAAAVEYWRRGWKPLRDKGNRGKVGAYRMVSQWCLGGQLGPDSVERIYKRWRHMAAADPMPARKAFELKKMFNPEHQRHPRFVVDGDPPYESPRHARFMQSIRRTRIRTV